MLGAMDARALAVVVTLAAALAPLPDGSAARADPVRVAVVGFTGDLTPQELTDLAANIRASLSRQADPTALVVVTREEMGRVYQQRGAACHPDDFGCIAEASEAWQGRLFVRGVVRKTSEGVVVGATLESVRNMLVAASQTPPSPKWDMGVVVPFLVRELLDGEKAHRARVKMAVAGVNGPGSGARGSDGAGASAGAVTCKCLAIESTAVAGAIEADDEGLRFESAPTAEKLQWRYGWDRVAKVEAASHGANPAIRLSSTTGDALTVFFSLGDERDRCLAGIARKRAPLPR